MLTNDITGPPSSAENASLESSQAATAVHIEQPVRVRLSAWGDMEADFMEKPFLVVSDRMRGALDRAGVDNAQYYPATLQGELSKREDAGYWLANIVGRLCCWIAQRPAWRTKDASIAGCQSLVIDVA